MAAKISSADASSQRVGDALAPPRTERIIFESISGSSQSLKCHLACQALRLRGGVDVLVKEKTFLELCTTRQRLSPFASSVTPCLTLLRAASGSDGDGEPEREPMRVFHESVCFQTICRLAQLDGGGDSPATVLAVADAVAAAEYVLTDVRSQPFYHHASDAAEGAAAAAQWVHADGVLHLAAFCRLLDKGAGSVPRAYVVGAALTAADIAVFVLVLQLQRLTPLVPAAFPLLAAWFARIQVICSHTRVRIFLAYC